MLQMYRGPIENLLGRNWPNTPSDEKLKKIHERITFSGTEGILRAVPDTIPGLPTQTIRETKILADWYNAQEHRLAAFMLFSKTKFRTADDRLDFLTDMAEEGESTTMMGLSLQSDPPGLEDVATQINFDSMPRDPEWTGISPVWANVRGTHVIVQESRITSGTPGIILAMPPRNVSGVFTSENPFPKGLAETVRDILLWHGALEVNWWSGSS